MEKGLVSIITPMYNAQKYIAKTIQSVLSQTYEHWEMIISDDGSTDDSSLIVLEYAKTDDRIRLISHEKNQGISQMRNDAIASAKGQYIAFLDSDDIWCEDKLQKQIAYMENNNTGFSYTSCGIMDENDKVMPNIRQAVPKVTYQMLLKGNPINCLTVVIDREKIPKVYMPQIPHEDYVAWLMVLQEGHIASGMGEVLAYYRINRSSRSGNKRKAAGWMWNIYRKYLNLDILHALYYFCCYAIAAVWKRRPRKINGGG